MLQLIKSIRISWMKTPFTYKKYEYGYWEGHGIIDASSLNSLVEKGYKCHKRIRHSIYILDILSFSWTSRNATIN